MAGVLTCLKAGIAQARRGLMQINERRVRSPRIMVQGMRVEAMYDRYKLGDELQALKSEVSHLLNATGDDVFDAAKTSADAIASQIRSALNELGETLSEQEDHVDKLIAERPIATLASAFALGVVIGLMLRRH